MLKCFNKMITVFLAASCLLVAVLNVRLMMSTSSSVEFSIPKIKFATKIAEVNQTLMKEFDTKLAEIKFPETRPRQQQTNFPKAKIAETKEQANIVLKSEVINFEEPVKLSKIKAEYSLPTNLLALAPNFKFEEKVMLAKTEIKEDKISTVLAAPVAQIEEEPIFFEYPVEEQKLTHTNEVPVEDKSIESHDKVSVAQAVVYTKEDYEQMADEFIAFDYSAQETKKEESVIQTSTTQSVVSSGASIKSFKVVTPNKQSKTSTVAMNTQKPKEKEADSVTTQKQDVLPTIMSIQAKATNFKSTKAVKNFEVRFQDDLNEIYEDFGAGEVQLLKRVNTTMNRSMVLLKRGYTPTNTDLIVENNSKVTLPLIEEDTFNNLLEKHGVSSGGALLIEYDDETETVLLDAEYAEEVVLDQNLKRTSEENFRYKLFVGIKAGNVYITYRRFDGTKTSKIVHVHEREISFDANIYEDIKHTEVKLYEEGLLSKELSPLIMNGDQVRVFATDITSKKQSQNTYKLNKKRSLLGERQYLEIGHLDEPIFVGYRDTNKIVLPSEDFIEFVLSKFENRKLGNRCVIQVNINAPVASYYVGTESAGNGLVTSSQVLDRDGKFYDSVGPKSHKIIILGENHGFMEYNQDGKVNIKIDYLDGSTRFLSSYCSPNTYLVEQL